MWACPYVGSSFDRVLGLFYNQDLAGFDSNISPSSKMGFGAAATLVLAAFISCMLFIKAWRKTFQKGKLHPGPTPLPLVGNLLQVKGGEMVKSLLALRNTYGSVFTVHLGLRRVVVICGYEPLKEALIDHGDVFVARGGNPIFERMFHGYGVTISNGERWKKLRQFTVTTLRTFGMGKRGVEERIQEESENFVNVLRDTKGAFSDPSPYLDYLSANVIFSIILGTRFDFGDEKLNSLLRSSTEGFLLLSSIWGQLYEMYPGIMYYLPGPHNKLFKIFVGFEEFLMERVTENQATLDVNSPRDFIDYYLIRKEQEKQNPLSEFHIQNLIPTLVDVVFGGVETVSTTVKYGLLMLLKHPAVEGKIQEEIDREIGQHRSPSYEDRTKMPYTQAVVHEIQRFCDLLPMGVPHAVTCDILFRGYMIPKGTDVYPMLTTALRDPTQFDEPENFNPGHFLDENGAFKKHKAFVPFSIGKRNCLGEGLARMEIFLFLVTILQNFKLKSPLDIKDIDLTPLETGIENVPRPFKIAFIPR
ncbi:cytochrome P450 2A13-like [Ambystoma mexicanum]|uniref:cytochrome P450 2A13-like n=1 Tax=Ambystoma mexicanum TaxID=8296 RepID=UPI0037E90F85